MVIKIVSKKKCIAGLSNVKLICCDICFNLYTFRLGTRKGKRELISLINMQIIVKNINFWVQLDASKSIKFLLIARFVILKS